MICGRCLGNVGGGNCSFRRTLLSKSASRIVASSFQNRGMDTKLPFLRDSNPLKITASGQIPESQAAKPTVFVSTGPIFPLKDTKCEMREVQQLYATSTRQTPWQTAIRKGPAVRILLFIRIPIIPSVI